MRLSRNIFTTSLKRTSSFKQMMYRMNSTSVESWTQTIATNAANITTNLEIVDTTKFKKWKTYQILDPNGKILENAVEPFIEKSTLLNMYKMTVRIQALDDIFYNAQRQGRISFYMQSTGEECIHIGSAAALQPSDVVLAQYREVGILLWRGFTLQEAADQCFSNESDLGKGRQMPVHYGSNKLNYQTISSPLATQLPQAVGVGYALKLRNSNSLPVCYFGEGAASEGDFHAALNFSSTLDVPMIFLCRNNGYAISTPTVDQYRGDGIASRAVGYGIYCIRVDGNDILAMYSATAAARQLALEKSRPVLIEAMTYRQGHHSTSDDSTRYRSSSEISYWHEKLDAVKRFRLYLENRGWWSEEEEQQLRDAEKIAVLTAMQTAENKPKPALGSLFEDVYVEKPSNLIKQEQELLEQIKLHPEYYHNSSNNHNH